MTQFINDFNIAWKSVAVGFVLYPVTMYILSRFGSVLLEDVKQIGYKVWDKIKSLMPSHG